MILLFIPSLDRYMIRTSLVDALGWHEACPYDAL